MRSWQLDEIEVEAHSPQVLHSADEGRVIAIQLSAGESLGEHQVHERGWLVVVSGEVEIRDSGGGTTAGGGAGLLVEFDPNERREIAATDDSRLLLVLSPWPGDGHPSAPR